MQQMAQGGGQQPMTAPQMDFNPQTNAIPAWRNKN
jgi:hypothetical protein